MELLALLEGRPDRAKKGPPRLLRLDWQEELPVFREPAEVRLLLQLERGSRRRVPAEAEVPGSLLEELLLHLSGGEV